MQAGGRAPAAQSRGSAWASARRGLRASAVDSNARQRAAAARRSRSQASPASHSSASTGRPPLSASCTGTDCSKQQATLTQQAALVVGQHCQCAGEGTVSLLQTSCGQP